MILKAKVKGSVFRSKLCGVLFLYFFVSCKLCFLCHKLGGFAFN